MFGGFHPMGLFSKGLCMEVLTKGFLSQKRKNPPGTKAPWVKNPLGQNPPIIIIRGFCPTFMFGGFCPKGFCLWGVLSGGFCLRGVLPQGGFVLHPFSWHYWRQTQIKQTNNMKYTILIVNWRGENLYLIWVKLDDLIYYWGVMQCTVCHLGNAVYVQV